MPYDGSATGGPFPIPVPLHARGHREREPERHVRLELDDEGGRESAPPTPRAPPARVSVAPPPSRPPSASSPRRASDSPLRNAHPGASRDVTRRPRVELTRRAQAGTSPSCSTCVASRTDYAPSSLSHELVEASTDPLVQTNAAYLGVDLNHLVWDITPGGGIADLCAFEPQSFQRLVGTFMVQRIWSNAAAAAGQDPCTPGLPASRLLKNSTQAIDNGATKLTVRALCEARTPSSRRC